MLFKHEEKSKDDLMKESLESYLVSKKTELLREKLEILTKYNVTKALDLKTLIKNGKVKEHPAWEDFIEIENIDSEINQIDNDIRSIHKN